ncbi:S-layer homology domain-containing protein [Ructibacterium gallinarum]|uniref:S-layer homology domain-containing protein n=1 Tax=Ructibacterium gallinarum TaxID=2779355 RepID=A0A9D5LZT0_9FIRM|nr:S-layer homology domain-containing protein [Ructibacterium gallinarum]MBE5039531.1 S-layer homology domain-containing protein [Ructibacterium gallinarum]
MKKSVMAIWIAVVMMVSLLPPVWAAENQADFILEDVTESDLTTLEGESKIKVSLDGIQEKVYQIQIVLTFTGNVRYKSIVCHANTEGEVPKVLNVLPNGAEANATGIVRISMINLDGMDLEGLTDLVTLTFEGEPGADVRVSLEDLTATYCMIGDVISGEKVYPKENAVVEAKASDTSHESVQTSVKFRLDDVTDFAAVQQDGAYASTGITLTLTAENIPNYVFCTDLNNIPLSKGGHRDATQTIPTFQVDNILIKDTYTVSLQGLGYISYQVSGVSFDEPLVITTSQFIPGDVDGDGAVTQQDFESFLEAEQDAELSSLATDFNRDGVTDKFDREVFGDRFENTAKPGVCLAFSAQGGSRKISVKWEKPEQEGGSAVNGYRIYYGTDQNNLDKVLTIEDGAAVSAEITGLSANMLYYLAMSAVNDQGEGERTEIISAKTASNNNTGGTGSGGGTSSGGIGGTGGAGIGGGISGGNTGGNPQSGGENNTAAGFSDLVGYEWAADAILQLNQAGIIKGISASEFAPGEQIKRCDFILILTRMLNIEDVFTENFVDVPTDSYYYDAVGSAKAAGVAQGDGSYFMPEDSITRQDLIILAYRAFLNRGYIEETDDLSVLDQFADREAVSDYARAGMASMVSQGVIQGSDGNVNPLGNATRAEVAVMCARLLALMN